MKNLFAIFSIGILFLACSKNDKKIDSSDINQTSDNKKEFVVDSLKVEDSLTIGKTLTASFREQVLVFPSIEDKVLLDSIYSATNIKADAYDATSLEAVIKQSMQKYFLETKESSKDWSPDFKQTWNESSAMKVFSHNQDLLTIKYFGDGFSGGAHGYYYENYKVFDLADKKVISINHIFENPKDAAWNEILMKNFTNKDQKEMILVDKIELNDNFYFDDQGITFVYNQYEITAYAAGVVNIYLKYNDIKDKLKPEFVKNYIK